MSQQCDIACHRLSFTAEENRLYEALKKKVFYGLVRMEELADGYCFVLPHNSSSLHDLADWMPLEHKCCPFLQFTVSLHQDEYVRLSLTGPREVKQFLLDQLGLADV